MNHRRARKAWWLLLVAASCLPSSLSCAKSTASPFVESDADAPRTDPGLFAEGGTQPSTNNAPAVECAEETRQIYVLGTDKGLYRFYPEQLKFVRVGTLGCPTTAETFSMAIDRRGTAWVEFTDGRLFEVSTSDATCKPTPFQPGQTGFEFFGMGYARNDDEKGETLYVSGTGLASLDTTSFELKFLGSLSFGRTELTGMDTALFAFSLGSGVIAGLDKATAATKVVHRTSAIDDKGGFAFAHWGGDFWVFSGRTTSTVTKYSPTDDTSTVAVADTGMLIVGAGSSTCAPTTPPK